MTRTLILAVLLALPASAQTAPQVEAPPSSDAAGFLHGTVRAKSGTAYRGLIRWGTQEFFWDDLFNADKRELPHLEDAPPEARRRGERELTILERVFRVVWDDDEHHVSRQLWLRFGDIAKIESAGRGRARVTMKNGTVYEAEGGGNDLSDALHVWDPTLGEIDVEWRSIESVEFSPSPAGVKPPGSRLSGKARTAAGEFSGFIQWDAEECITIDKLDGDGPDGRLSIEMGKIRSLERASRRSTRVVLADGRSLELSGTNDVDSSIRGIYVEDPRYGRVEISWDAFERLDFDPPGGSGPGYDAFRPASLLSGTVTSRGKALSGRLIFDLDETDGHEILQGSREGVEFYIPFSLVAAIEPRGSSASLVRLRSGEELRLEDGQDVSEDNSGLLVFTGPAEPTYVPWDEVQSVRFD